jgi:hypothetical protein
MGENDRLRNAYRFINGKDHSFRGSSPDPFIRETLRIQREHFGLLGVSGRNLEEIFEIVTHEKPEFGKDLSMQDTLLRIRAELSGYGILPVIVPEKAETE